MLEGKTILVTGGTGSFGKAFVRKVLSCHKPRRIIVLSRDELKQHEMQPAASTTPGLRVLHRRRARPRAAAAGVRGGCDIVVHAAALKQVPACEYNPFEAIKTNVLGAQNVIDAAIDCGVQKVFAL